MCDTAKGRREDRPRLDTRLASACVKTGDLLTKGHLDDLWVHLGDMGPYALPIVLLITSDYSSPRRKELLEFIVESLENGNIDPKYTEAFLQFCDY